MAQELSRRLRTALLSLGLASLSSGCAGGIADSFALGGGARAVSGDGVQYIAAEGTGGAAGGVIDRLFIGECLREDRALEAASLGAILIPALIKGAVVKFGELLERAGERQVHAAYASRSWDAPPAGDVDGVASGDARSGVFGGAPGGSSGVTAGGYLPRCIQFVRGEFAPPDQGAAVPPPPGFGPAEWDNIASQFRDIGVAFAATPEVLFEARIVVSRERSHYLLEPRYFWYGGALGSDFLTSQRGLFVEFSINAAPATMNDAATSVGVLPLGNMSVGSFVRFNTEGGRTVDARSPNMIWAPAGKDSIGGKAVNVEIRLVEVRDARPILAEIGKFIKTNEQIPGAIQSALFPPKTDTLANLEARSASAAKLSESLSKLAGLEAELSALEAQASAEPPNSDGRETLERLAAVKRAEIEIERQRAAVHADRAGIALPSL